MADTKFDSRVKVSQIIKNQLPEFISSSEENFVDFLKQYYISLEHRGAAFDIANNFDQYISTDNLTADIVSKTYTLSQDVGYIDDEIFVSSTAGFPEEYGLLKINNEIITYTEKTETSFTGCIRGFSGVESYEEDRGQQNLVFKTTNISEHNQGDSVINLSNLFLKEFFKKLKYQFLPGLENNDLNPDVNVGSFIKQAKSLYQTKGTDGSFEILFKVLYGVNAEVIDTEKFLLKSSSAEFIRRKVLFGKLVSGQDPLKVAGQTLISSDGSASAPISEIDYYLSSTGENIYKISISEGYDEEGLLIGKFKETPLTKVIGNVPVGSTTITVDSTVSFPNSGTIISGSNNEISYTRKTVNQFFGCSNITTEILDTDEIKGSNYAISYEDGDINKPVIFELKNILSDFNFDDDEYTLIESGDKILVNNLGEYIRNNQEENTFKEFIFNSWIYNTSSRFEIESSESNTTHILAEFPDKVSLKKDDNVKIFRRGANESLATAKVENISRLQSDSSKGSLKLKEYEGENLGEGKYDIKRIIKTASSSSTTIPLEFSNVSANIQNTYDDGGKNIFVATNSLPDYEINPESIFEEITDTSSIGASEITISRPSLRFLTGDKITYTHGTGNPITGLTSGNEYYIKVVDSNKIKLYNSLSEIYTDANISLATESGIATTHRFTLSKLYNKKLSPSFSLRKYPISTYIDVKEKVKTPIDNTVGSLINGVEIFNYKGIDNVFYGPLSDVIVSEGGSGYDAVYPPKIEIDAPTEVGGTTALVSPVIAGTVHSVLLDEKDIPVKSVKSVSILGGNGTGAVLEPVIENRFREFEFDASSGVNNTTEAITFTQSHYFEDGQKVVYSTNGNNPLGIGTYQGSNVDQNKYLLNGGTYFAKYISSKSIGLYETKKDYLAGINTVGFTTVNKNGIHKIRSFNSEEVLSDIRVTNSGNNYQYRKLIITSDNRSTSISTTRSTINYKDHGFDDRSIVKYESTSTISGLTNDQDYYVIKIDNDSFRLAATKDDHTNKKYISIESIGGSVEHSFKYLPISVDIKVSYANTEQSVSATPVVRGEVIDLYVYEKGSKYGSEILNYEKLPLVSISSGKNAIVQPVIINGKIDSVFVIDSGSEYHSLPDLIVNGSGSGAKLKPVINPTTGSLTAVTVINSGFGYTSDTTISVKTIGTGLKLTPKIRSLTLDNNKKFGSEYFKKITTSITDVSYSVTGYFDEIRSSFEDNVGTENNDFTHSPIIGWAYDGNPIYGAFGYSNPSDGTTVKRLESSYTLDTSLVEDRPNLTDFPAGTFIEDYTFDGSGDLDEHNGRFTKTPDFPNGIYAYFAPIEENTNIPNTFQSVFPYFVGDTYRSSFIKSILENTQENFDIQNSGLLRNTAPYRVGQKNSSNDYIDFDFSDKFNGGEVESSSRGDVDSFTVSKNGFDYAIGDPLVFDNSTSGGSGVSAEVSEILGKTINNISVSRTKETGFVLENQNGKLKLSSDTYHNFTNNNFVKIDNLSTPVSGLSGFYKIESNTLSTTLNEEIVINSGVVTDIFVANIPSSVSAGNTIGIGTENLEVLNVFEQERILRVKRSVTGIAHAVGTGVTYRSSSFTIPFQIEELDSYENNKVYFNPTQSVGIGTTVGLSTSVSYTIGNSTQTLSIPTQTIYLPNHGFKDRQKVTIGRVSGVSSIGVYDYSTDSEFKILESLTEEVFVIKKSDNSIGIVTSLTGLGNTVGLAFTSAGADNYEYYFESKFNQITADVTEINCTVSVASSHGLNNNDNVTLSLLSNKNVGIGTSTHLRLRFDESTQKILVNSIGFNSTGINTTSNIIEIPNNDLRTGDKVYYETDISPSGLENNSFYYVFKVSDDKIKLSETLNDATGSTVKTISIGSTGGSDQKLSLVNPQIDVVKNNNLVFDISDSSFENKNIEFFGDENFINSYSSSSDISSFNVVGVGTAGNSGAKVTLNHSSSLDFNLYYAVKDETTGKVISADKDVKNYSKISYIDSFYNNNTYIVSAASTTTFQINLVGEPERDLYISSDVDSFSYSTDSKNAIGPISKIRKISPGFNYAFLPKFLDVTSSKGDGAGIKLVTKNIGNSERIKTINSGYSFPTDKTLSPSGNLPIIANIIKDHEIKNIVVTSGGSDYYTDPGLVLVDSETRESVDTVSFEVERNSNSIENVTAINSKGLDLKNYELFTIDNSNGVSVSKVEYSSSGIVTCTLVTPIGGFNIPPFSDNQEIFVEGIEKSGNDGDGFNSADVGYKFFTIAEYLDDTSPARVVFDISSFSTNPGIALTDQIYASIVPKSKYPIFEVNLEESKFIENEQLLIDIGNGYVLSENNVIKSDASIAKIIGPDLLKKEYKIQGRNSGSTAEINAITSLGGRFTEDVIYSTTDGWKNNIGNLSDDIQVLPDNDYYQNLSYSIKSPIEYERFIDPVNKIIHSSGLKNFGNLGITSSVSTGVGAAISDLSFTTDYITDVRVDIIKDFDTVKDVDVQFISADNKKSKYVEFQNKRLTDFFVCKTNKVLSIDNVENEFSSTTLGQEQYVDLLTYPKSVRYTNFLVQSVGIASTERQLNDIVVLNNNLDSFTIDKGTLTNSETVDYYADVNGFIDPAGNLSLRYEPINPFDKSYNIKIYRTFFDTTVTGVGTTSIGFVDITGNVESVGVGSTAQILGIATESSQALLSEIFVNDLTTNQMNFFEVAVVNDGIESKHSEYFVDTEKLSGKSQSRLVSIGSTIESGILKLNITNDSSNKILYKARTTNIDSPSVGTAGTYRFLAPEQPEGSERSMRLESNHVETGSVGVGTTVLTFDVATIGSVKSLIRIKNTDTNNTSMHQVMMVNDGADSFMMPKFYVSIGNTTGIGTFESQIDGSELNLLFYPDFTANYEISSYSHVLYEDLDSDNIITDKEYGNITETLKNSRFNSINGDGNDQLEFEMEYNGVPIFQKTFNPTNAGTLSTSTGIFTINDHFFSNNEEVTYESGATFIDVTPSSVGIGTTIVGGTQFTGDFITGLSTITGISSTLLDFFEVGQIISGPSIPTSTEIVSIGNTFQYFTGNIVGVASTVITGVANTSILKVNAGIFSGDGTSLGTIQSIGNQTVTSDQTIDVGTGRTYYTDTLGLGISLSNPSTSTQIRKSFSSGISTDVCPSDVYIIKLSPNTFKITGTNNSGIGFTFTSTGAGNAHKLTMKKNIEKTLINLNGIVQYPLSYSNISYTLEESINSSQEFISLSGITTVNPTDLLKIGDEYVEVQNVGFGTTSIGPITGIGTTTLVKVKRGFVGSTANSHSSGVSADLYKGSYDIVGNKLHFTHAPKGSGENDREDSRGLNFSRDTFNGRVFLRSDYSTNIVYDNISSEFNGIGRTFAVRYNGEDIDTIESGSPLLFINEVFQTPTSSNNAGNNYEYTDNGDTTTVTFTGITNPDDNVIVTSDTDVNQNGVPRGGVIVSLGSTPGLGYAPLVGASVTAVVSGGSIVSVGLGITDHNGSGYNDFVGIAVTVFEEGHSGTAAEISATVGLGGTLTFNVDEGGNGYNNPQIFVSDPAYSNLGAYGISRIGVGTTTDTGSAFAVNLEVGAGATVGVGSTYFGVTNFEVINFGYDFRLGDKFTVAGLVTDATLSEPIHQFELEVLGVYNDNFGSWQLGELDYIDSIKLLQNGVRQRFPLNYNGDLLNFEIDINDPDSAEIDLKELLLIFINGILQVPGDSYDFSGGTSIIFTSPPSSEDNVDIFFYRGTRGTDSFQQNILETVGIGDELQIKRDPDFEFSRTQDPRVIFDLRESDLVETVNYGGVGIVTEGDVVLNPSKITDIKFTDIIPQKADIVANGENISKARKRLASSVYPTTRLIRDIATSDTEIFVEDANSFNYEENELGKAIVEFDVLVTEGTDKELASTEVTVSSASTISSIGIISGGSGYGSGGTIDVKISTPPSGIGAGIGTIAEATATVSAAGTIASVSITNGGLGYSTTTSPQVLIPLPNPKIETISVSNVEGFSGIVTGIGTTTTSGNPAIKFELYNEDVSFGDTLEVGYPFFVSNSVLGTGVTSLTGAGVIIGIGTTYADNIYEVAEVSISPNDSKLGIVTCRATYEDSSLDYTAPYAEGHTTKITAGIGSTSNSGYGSVVAIGTDKIVVGSPYANDVGLNTNAGAVYVYDHDGTNEIKITASDPSLNAWFGNSVAIGTDKIVVGSPSGIFNSTDVGKVYIYDHDGTNEIKITDPQNNQDMEFGESVAIENDRIFVSAVGDYNTPITIDDLGRVYIYDLSGTQVGVITDPDPNFGGGGGHKFGSAIAVGDGKLLIAAENGGNNNLGEVHIYDFDGNNATFAKTINNPDATGPLQKYGGSVAVGDGKIVVGDPNDIIDFGKGGSVFVYDLDGSNVTRIRPSDPETFKFFGYSVAVKHNKIFIGATGQGGSVYVYNLDGTREIKITASDGEIGDNFGTAVAIGTDKVVIGASNDQVGVGSTGSVYVYDLDLRDNIDVFGNFSWGRFSTLTRATSPQSYTVSGNTVSGLSTYPQIQRRGYGLNDSGAYSN